MKLSIEEIERLLKDRCRYFLEFSQDIKSIVSGQMAPPDAQETIAYLSKITNSRVPSHESEKKLYLLELKEQCDRMAKVYMELLRYLKHSDKDIALIGLYISLQGKLEISQYVKTVGTLIFFEAEQLKTIRSALSRHLPLGYQYLQEGVKYKFDKSIQGIDITFDMKHHSPDYQKYKEKLKILLSHEKILLLSVAEKEALMQPLAEVDTTNLLIRMQQQPICDLSDISKYVIYQLTTMFLGYKGFVSVKKVVSNLTRELQDDAEKTQLKASTPEALKVAQEKIIDLIERISDALLTLNSSHAIVPIENYIDLLKDTERLLEACQILRETFSDDILSADSMEKLSANRSKFDSQIQKMNTSLIVIEHLIADHQSKIEKQKAEKRVWYAEQQQLQTEIAREIDLKQLNEFKMAQAEKISKRKAELMALKEAKKAEKRSIFTSEQPAKAPSPAPIIGVNASMMDRLMQMRDEHISLILSILTLQGKIYYSDVESLILNQLAGNISEFGSSHKRITLGVLYTEMHINEEQTLPIKKTVTGGIARPHKPGHSVVPLSKLNTKLVRHTLIAAGITLDAMEDIIARREHAPEIVAQKGDVSSKSTMVY